MEGDGNRPQGTSANPLNSAFERTMEIAERYFQLQMWDAAWAELEELRPELRHHSRVIMLRVLILNNLEKWEDAAVLGMGALQHYPQIGPLYLAAAHALRHAQNIPSSSRRGSPSRRRPFAGAAPHFMLASYECQLGNLEAAKAELRRAFELDERLRLRSLREADLEPLWDSLGDP